jgi:hypothetical protein
MSFWMILLGGLTATSGFFFGGAADAGWTFYSPLTSIEYSPGAGISLAGAGLTFKLVYEARLVDSWQQREAANSTSETGIESAKRWLESELDKGTVFSEGSVIKADDGSPNYCLKGFKVDEITSLKTETVLLSTELGDENFKNYTNFSILNY